MVTGIAGMKQAVISRAEIRRADINAQQKSVLAQITTTSVCQTPMAGERCCRHLVFVDFLFLTCPTGDVFQTLMGVAFVFGIFKVV
ncbi:hypothetical protein DBV39_03980 [Orrella marina]|uniref:Uncharacterized protein n=1 Tax=Orrella marina TaxID=2163011 RepID=A0A2R4XGX5_9BURK|nr:hypothetical protein DBV39_03980 [Orrella marina]